VPTAELIEHLKVVADTIGPYPHKAIRLEYKEKKQTTGMIKVVCDADGTRCALRRSD
jgi:hypothetical protein